METKTKGFIDTFECAKYLSISVSKLRKLTANRDIPFYKISRNKCLFKVEELDKWVKCTYMPTNQELREKTKVVTRNFD